VDLLECFKTTISTLFFLVEKFHFFFKFITLSDFPGITGYLAVSSRGLSIYASLFRYLTSVTRSSKSDSILSEVALVLLTICRTSSAVPRAHTVPPCRLHHIPLVSNLPAALPIAAQSPA
jgi:hypothetical protein